MLCQPDPRFLARAAPLPPPPRPQTPESSHGTFRRAFLAGNFLAVPYIVVGRYARNYRQKQSQYGHLGWAGLRQESIHDLSSA